VINELEAQGASMIAKDQKRAKVELSFDEYGGPKPRKDLKPGERKPEEIPIDKMMSKSGEAGAVKIDLERLSQTGGNLGQAYKKRVGEEVRRRGRIKPRKRFSSNSARTKRRRALGRRSRLKRPTGVLSGDKAANIDWTPELRASAKQIGVKYDEEYDKWSVGWTQVNSKALLAIMADTALSDEGRKQEMVLAFGCSPSSDDGGPPPEDDDD
jgi:hypothetical protein